MERIEIQQDENEREFIQIGKDAPLYWCVFFGKFMCQWAYPPCGNDSSKCPIT